MINARGFTLIETILILSIIMVLFGLPTVIANKTYEKVQKMLFFEAFQSHLLATQNYALLAKKKTSLTIFKSGTVRYQVLSEAKGVVNQELTIPKSLTVDNNNSIRYAAKTGRPSSFKTIKFKSLDKSYTFKFQMGSGRYIFEESE